MPCEERMKLFVLAFQVTSNRETLFGTTPTTFTTAHWWLRVERADFRGASRVDVEQVEDRSVGGGWGSVRQQFGVDYPLEICRDAHKYDAGSELLFHSVPTVVESSDEQGQAERGESAPRSLKHLLSTGFQLYSHRRPPKPKRRAFKPHSEVDNRLLRLTEANKERRYEQEEAEAESSDAGKAPTRKTGSRDEPKQKKRQTDAEAAADDDHSDSSKPDLGVKGRISSVSGSEHVPSVSKVSSGQRRLSAGAFLAGDSAGRGSKNKARPAKKPVVAGQERAKEDEARKVEAAAATEGEADSAPTREAASKFLVAGTAAAAALEGSWMTAHAWEETLPVAQLEQSYTLSTTAKLPDGRRLTFVLPATSKKKNQSGKANPTGEEANGRGDTEA
eukprot:GHVT01102621.1.p1 GENE.GHVT01102621.1~~GHVT01102621.1.p1  ORF type:complete len:390 (-),score=78.54 GHVT01102621.1:219-1388(-)